MKWKTVIILLVIAVVSLTGVLWGYNFDQSELTSVSFYQNIVLLNQDEQEEEE